MVEIANALKNRETDLLPRRDILDRGQRSCSITDSISSNQAWAESCMNLNGIKEVTNSILVSSTRQNTLIPYDFREVSSVFCLRRRATLQIDIIFLRPYDLTTKRLGEAKATLREHLSLPSPGF
jgi:hypothetical protein